VRAPPSRRPTEPTPPTKTTILPSTLVKESKSKYFLPSSLPISSPPSKASATRPPPPSTKHQPLSTTEHYLHTSANMAASTMHPAYYQTYAERSEDPNLTPLATYLLRLIHLKRTNLCVSADVTTTNELLALAEDVGDHICVLKTHADIISDFNDKTIRGLNEISRRKQFIVFEDRKFGDIGSMLLL